MLGVFFVNTADLEFQVILLGLYAAVKRRPPLSALSSENPVTLFSSGAFYEISIAIAQVSRHMSLFLQACRRKT